MTTLLDPQPWHTQCPVDLAKLLNLLGSVETYLRPRAVSPHQRTLVGQISYLRNHIAEFSDQTLPSRRPTGRHKKLLRAKVLERDGHRCTLCGATDNLEMHHKVPLSQGGTNHLNNLQTLCDPCHKIIHDMEDL